MCGKDLLFLPLVRTFIGSPPRVREELIGDFDSMLGDRITPACAGRTLWSYPKKVSVKDHPRMCGKNAEIKDVVGDNTGSPPLAREELRFGIS